MSDDFLNSLTVSSTPAKKAWSMMLYGVGGVNKTGLATYAPDPFFICFDKNAGWINKPAFRNANNHLILPNNLEQAYQMIGMLKKKSFRESLEKPIKTVVFDGITYFQDFIHNDIIAKRPTVTDRNGTRTVTNIIELGYDGVCMVKPYWEKFIATVDGFNNAGFNVIVVGHETEVNSTTEQGESIKRKQINLLKYGAIDVPIMIGQAFDIVFRLKTDVSTAKVGAGKWSKTVGIGGSETPIIVQTRSDSISFAKCNSIDDSKFPDYYEFTTFDRDEVVSRIFRNIDGNFE